MKRVGNKSGQLVRSASRRNKTASRFQFDIRIEKITGLKAGSTYYVKFARGVKEASSKHFQVASETAKAGHPVNETISLPVTLYREDGKKFDSKEGKLSILAVNMQRKPERTTAKTRFDLSALAGVPSASTPKSLKLSDRVTVTATVDSRFLKSGAPGPGSAGASSMMSDADASVRSSDEGDEFDDLVVDDVPEPEVIAPSSSRVRNASSPQPKPEASTSFVPKAAPIRQESSRKPASPQPPLHTQPRQESSRRPSPEVSLSTQPSPRNQSESSGKLSLRSEEAPSPKQKSSPFSRGRRDRPQAVTPDEISAFSRIDEESKVNSLKERNERLSSELELARRDAAAQHSKQLREIESLSEQLKSRTRELQESCTSRDSVTKSVADLEQKNASLERESSTFRRELEAVKQDRDKLKCRVQELDSVAEKLRLSESKCRDLSSEVGRLSAIASRAGSSTEGSESGEDQEKALSELKKEKILLQNRVQAHESHISKVRSTYKELSNMYNKLCEEHGELQVELATAKEDLESTKEKLGNALTGDRNDNFVAEQLGAVREELSEARNDRDVLQGQVDELVKQKDTLQDRLDSTTVALDEARREAEEYAAEAEEMKGQRDLAMQRALSRGKSNSSSDGFNSRSTAKMEEELRQSKQKYDSEVARLNRKNEELHSHVTELQEDVEYERNEKTKAREERDKIRETARALERRTSQAARATDAMNSMRRQLSSHQMRAQDTDSVISGLRDEICSLRVELEKSHNTVEDIKTSKTDLVDALVSAKLSLAEVKADKDVLEGALSKLRRSEKAVQRRADVQVTKLEGQLREAKDENDRLRKQGRLHHATDFNELGSDVDY